MKRRASGLLLLATAVWVVSSAPRVALSVARVRARDRGGVDDRRARGLVRGHGALPPSARHSDPAHGDRRRAQGSDRAQPRQLRVAALSESRRARGEARDRCTSREHLAKWLADAGEQPHARASRRDARSRAARGCSPTTMCRQLIDRVLVERIRSTRGRAAARADADAASPRATGTRSCSTRRSRCSRARWIRTRS